MSSPLIKVYSQKLELKKLKNIPSNLSDNLKLLLIRGPKNGEVQTVQKRSWRVHWIEIFFEGMPTPRGFCWSIFSSPDAKSIITITNLLISLFQNQPKLKNSGIRKYLTPNRDLKRSCTLFDEPIFLSCSKIWIGPVLEIEYPPESNETDTFVRIWKNLIDNRDSLQKI
jgi:hypothetical protein